MNKPLEKDAVYGVEVKCPICDYEAFTFYKLRSKTQRIELDRFLVPKYEGIKGYPASDYLNLSVAVCPSCFYSSFRESEFISLSKSVVNKKPDLPPKKLKDALLNDKENRKLIVTKFELQAKDFERPRSDKAAFASYLLAIKCAKIKVEHEKQYSLAELGTYYLYAAHFAELLDSKDIAEQFRRDAIPYFAKAYEKTDFNPDHEFDVLYLNIFLNLYNNDKAKAYSYLTVIDRKRRELKHKGLDTSKVDNFWTKIQDLLYELQEEAGELKEFLEE